MAPLPAGSSSGWISSSSPALETGSANLGDGSCVLVVLDSASYSLAFVFGGECFAVATSDHNGTSVRSSVLVDERNAIDCPAWDRALPTRTRDWLNRILTLAVEPASLGALDALVKRWPLIVFNSGTPQEAITFLLRQQLQLANNMPPELTRFAHELHAASRYVMNHPPAWCPARVIARSRTAPFRFYELLEQQLTWAAHTFLQSLVGFSSVIWLHDGFWASPCPAATHITPASFLE